jgi:hypothetical protein
MATGAILASFMLSLQMYVTSRARMVARARLAYKYTFVMEDAAKMILNGRLEYLGLYASQGSTACATPGACCGTGKSYYDVSAEGFGSQYTVCLSSTSADLCLNGEACICPNAKSDSECADMIAFNDFRLKEKTDTMIALEGEEGDPSLAPAFDTSIFERLIPDFDRRFVAYVDRVVFKKRAPPTSLVEEARAETNASYTFKTTAPNPLRLDGSSAPVADSSTDALSPYPAGTLQAYTYRDCTTGESSGTHRCMDLRICVSATKEMAAGNLSEVCFHQRISRSFLWPHSAAPCSTSGCSDPADPLNPVTSEKGNASCLACPWRDRF